MHSEVMDCFTLFAMTILFVAPLETTVFAPI
jgi:hypothetical protein